MDPPKAPLKAKLDPYNPEHAERLGLADDEVQQISEDVTNKSPAVLLAELDALVAANRIPQHPRGTTYADLFDMHYFGQGQFKLVVEARLTLIEYEMARRGITDDKELFPAERGMYSLSTPRPARSGMVFGHACTYTESDSEDDVAWYQAPNPFVGGPGPTINPELPNLPDVIPGNPNEGSDNPNEFDVP